MPAEIICEECNERPAYHQARVAGCGDERICVCCECMEKNSLYSTGIDHSECDMTIDELRELVCR